jgi:hypothetical protein
MSSKNKAPKSSAGEEKFIAKLHQKRAYFQGAKIEKYCRI